MTAFWNSHSGVNEITQKPEYGLEEEWFFGPRDICSSNSKMPLFGMMALFGMMPLYSCQLSNYTFTFPEDLWIPSSSLQIEGSNRGLQLQLLYPRNSIPAFRPFKLTTEKHIGKPELQNSNEYYYYYYNFYYLVFLWH